jgi:hypothetical protein
MIARALDRTDEATGKAIDDAAGRNVVVVVPKDTTGRALVRRRGLPDVSPSGIRFYLLIRFPLCRTVMLTCGHVMSPKSQESAGRSELRGLGRYVSMGQI